MKPFRVNATTKPSKAASALAHTIKGHDGSPIEIHAMGAQAVYNAVKAIAIARRFLRDDNIDIACSPSFIRIPDTREEQESVVAISLVVEVID